MGLFIVEILLKMFALESTFWYDGWNIFDLFVISALWLSTNTLFFGANTKQAGGSLGAARVLRFIKVLRSMKSIKTLKVSSSTQKNCQTICLSLRLWDSVLVRERYLCPYPRTLSLPLSVKL